MHFDCWFFKPSNSLLFFSVLGCALKLVFLLEMFHNGARYYNPWTPKHNSLPFTSVNYFYSYFEIATHYFHQLISNLEIWDCVIPSGWTCNSATTHLESQITITVLNSLSGWLWSPKNRHPGLDCTISSVSSTNIVANILTV